MINCSVYRGGKIYIGSESLDEVKGSFSLDYLFKKFSQPEVLDKDNAWYCPKCKKHVSATKIIHIYKLPKYMIILLKKVKNSHQVIPKITFPLENLDMEQFVINGQSTG